MCDISDRLQRACAVAAATGTSLRKTSKGRLSILKHRGRNRPLKKPCRFKGPRALTEENPENLHCRILYSQVRYQGGNTLTALYKYPSLYLYLGYLRVLWALSEKPKQETLSYKSCVPSSNGWLLPVVSIYNLCLCMVGSPTSPNGLSS